MALVQLNLAPSRRDLRWFAGLWWPALCAAIGLMFLRKFHMPTTAIRIWVGGGLVAVPGVIWPSVIRPVYVALMLLTYPVGWCVSHVVLAGVYFLVVTPVGLLVRRFQDPMTRGFEPTESTYWTVRETTGSDRYFRQL
jgi:hypothetical protein